MAGRGPAPKPAAERRRTNAPARGEWQPTPGVGWQHGEIPRPPARMTLSARNAWVTWMQAWFAAHWSPDDLPVLRQVIRLYDAVERGQATGSERTELRQLMDSYGITPKGQQDRRWAPPAPAEADQAPAAKPPSHYGHLKVVNQ
jgi:hypothetical protein